MSGKNTSSWDLDVAVVGAGFSGLYILHELKKQNFNVHLFDDGDGPGGTWDKNRYPGARVDSEVWIYQFSDPDLWKNYSFKEKFPDAGALKDYFRFVVDRWDLAESISFNTRIESGTFDRSQGLWTIKLGDGKAVTTRHLILAMGSTSKPIPPGFPGAASFEGESYHTAQWPKTDVTFANKRVAVIGTGASGVQVIQEASRDADSLVVFQRTPNLALPMGQVQYSEQEYSNLKALFEPAYEKSRETYAGFTYDLSTTPWKELSSDEKTKIMETNWEEKGFRFWLGAPADLFFDDECNHDHYKFWRDRTRQRIQKEELVELLAPTEPPHPFGTKRPCLERFYFDLFNQDNVTLVDINQHPIREITSKGIIAGSTEYEFDMIVYAIGFDTCTGAISSVDITNSEGTTIGQLWEEESLTYLGKAVPSFPNLLYTYALQSPTAFLNGPTAAELEGDFIVDFLSRMKAEDVKYYEAREDFARTWGDRCHELGEASLFPRAKSWYMAANVPGKRAEIQPFIGGQNAYREALESELANDFPGFRLQAWD